MRYFLRNFHVLVFAVFSIGAAVWVGVDPARTVHMMEPVVEDAVEIAQVAELLYLNVERVNWEASAREAMAFYVSALTMPSMIFDRIDRQMAEVDRQLKEIGALSGSVGPSKKTSAQDVINVFEDFRS